MWIQWSQILLLAAVSSRTIAAPCRPCGKYSKEALSRRDAQPILLRQTEFQEALETPSGSTIPPLKPRDTSPNDLPSSELAPAPLEMPLSLSTRSVAKPNRHVALPRLSRREAKPAWYSFWKSKSEPTPPKKEPEPAPAESVPLQRLTTDGKTVPSRRPKRPEGPVVVPGVGPPGSGHEWMVIPGFDPSRFVT